MDVPRFYRSPLVSRSGKIVQVVINGIDYLRAEPRVIQGGRHLYHGDILESLLRELNMPFETADDSGPPHPKRASSDGSYELVGAGDLEIGEDKSYSFKGVSSTYDIGINREHLERMLPFLPQGATVKFGGHEADKIIGIGSGRQD